MTEICDNMAVGILVLRENSLLMLSRNTPYGMAPPAGHIDGHGSDQRAAVAELYEETGLKAVSVRRVWEGRRDNQCRRVMRERGHYWTVFSAVARGTPDPLSRIRWIPVNGLPALAGRTRQLMDGGISQEEFSAEPGLDPVWVGLLSTVGMIRCTERQPERADVRCAVRS